MWKRMWSGPISFTCPRDLSGRGLGPSHHAEALYRLFICRYSFYHRSMTTIQQPKFSVRKPFHQQLGVGNGPRLIISAMDDHDWHRQFGEFICQIECHLAAQRLESGLARHTASIGGQSFGQGRIGGSVEAAPPDRLKKVWACPLFDDGENAGDIPMALGIGARVCQQ